MDINTLSNNITELEYKKRNLEERKANIESSLNNITDPALLQILQQIRETNDTKKLQEIDQYLQEQSAEILRMISQSESEVSQIGNIN